MSILEYTFNLIQEMNSNFLKIKILNKYGLVYK